MAKRRRGASEEDILLLLLFLFGAMAVVGAMAVSVGASVLDVATEPTAMATATPADSVLDVATEPTVTLTATPTPTPTPTVTPTPTPIPTPTPTPTQTLTPTPTPTPPIKVAGLVAGPGGGSGEVQLMWVANREPDVAKYNVYKSDIKGGPYNKVFATVNNDQVAWLPDGTRGYIDSSASGERWYVVSAVDSTGTEGPTSDEACGYPPGLTLCLAQVE